MKTENQPRLNRCYCKLTLCASAVHPSLVDDGWTADKKPSTHPLILLAIGTDRRIWYYTVKLIHQSINNYIDKPVINVFNCCYIKETRRLQTFYRLIDQSGQCENACITESASADLFFYCTKLITKVNIHRKQRWTYM